jgi:hypothetical protein
MNKLTLDEQFLTLQQAKELIDLGIDFRGSNTLFCICTRNWQGNEVSQPAWKLVHSIKCIIKGFEKFEYVPTLSVAEMMEMIPMDIEAKSKKYGNQTVYLSIDRHSVMYCVSGIEFERGLYVYISFEKPLLRDALFEMIKWLKTNKLI